MLADAVVEAAGPPTASRSPLRRSLLVTAAVLAVVLTVPAVGVVARSAILGGGTSGAGDHPAETAEQVPDTVAGVPSLVADTGVASRHAAVTGGRTVTLDGAGGASVEIREMAADQPWTSAEPVLRTSGHLNVILRCGVDLRGVDGVEVEGRGLLAVAAPDGRCAVAHDPTAGDGAHQASAPRTAAAQETTVLGQGGGPSLLLIDLLAAQGPELVASTPMPALGTVLVAHPSAPLLYAVESSLDQRKGWLQIVLLDPEGRATPGPRVPATSGVIATDAAIDPLGARLHLAAHTHTQVLDLAQPAAPRSIGRIYDYMVRDHEDVTVEQIVDPVLGPRTFLIVTAPLRGGAACTGGTMFVYDVTGELWRRPLMIVETDVPGSFIPQQPGVPCAVPTLSLDGPSRRLDLTWTRGGAEVRTDRFPYDITPMFQASLDVCLLVDDAGRPI